jgi:hypothetical protein
MATLPVEELNRLAEAARVGRFITEDDEVGRWRIMHFDITEEHYRRSKAVAIAQGGVNTEERLRRTIPPGHYVTLLRKVTKGEQEDIEDGSVVDADSPHPGYIPIMSDTPAEIYEHGHAFVNAHGRVLITGLGLGCLVAALLSKPGVEHITVVEIDKDVLALTGKFYANEPRVTLVNDDAIRFAANYTGPDFDYAWHDIWSHIADRNLDDDSVAEHGISYQTMFDMYDPFCDYQGAWAYPEALKMRAAKEYERHQHHEWARQFIAETDMTVRESMLVDYHIRRMLRLDPFAELPDEVRQFAEEQFHVRDAVREQLAARPEMAEDLQRIMDEDLDDDEPMHRPNEDPEANVA